MLLILSFSLLATGGDRYAHSRSLPIASVPSTNPRPTAALPLMRSDGSTTSTGGPAGVSRGTCARAAGAAATSTQHASQTRLRTDVTGIPTTLILLLFFVMDSAGCGRS